MRRIRFVPGTSALALALALGLACLLEARFATAAVSVTKFTPGTENAAISGFTLEDFEDTTLLPGFSVTLSVWRNSANAITADPPLTYSGTLPTTWAVSTIGVANGWDGSRAFVNGKNFAWAYPYAATIALEFNPPRTVVGMGLSNFQHDVDSGNTFHSLTINGVSFGRLENLPKWVSNAAGKNFYLLVSGDVGDPIQSIVFSAETHFDGMVIDKLTLGDTPTPTIGSTWGRIKSLFR